MKNKKAQVGYNPQSYISLLILIIGVSMIVYILMLPPAERVELLEQNRTGLDNDDVRDDITILLTREPGTLTKIPDTEIIEDIPSFNLYTRTDAAVLIDFDSIYIKKSLFEEQQRNISFTINDLDNTDNYVLSFTSPKHKGILTIILNGYIVYSSEILSQSPAPIELPKDYLNNKNNLLFKVSGPGIEFWKSNEYIIQNMKITADVTDISAQENKQFIYVSAEEKENLESYELSFIVDCKESDVAPLQIYLNKRLIYNSVPDCGYKVKVPTVDERRLVKGENELLFRTERGSYLLYGIESKLNLKEPIFPTYYFTLSDDTYKDIDNDKADLNVTLLFTNDEDLKKGVIFVNDIKFEIDTYDKFFNKKINKFVREGNNAVEIRPESDRLDVLELQVILAE